MTTMHVLHKRAKIGKAPNNGGSKLVPFLGGSNDDINYITGREESLGVVLFESSQKDRDLVREAIADSCELDDASVLEWVEVVVRHQPV